MLNGDFSAVMCLVSSTGFHFGSAQISFVGRSVSSSAQVRPPHSAKWKAGKDGAANFAEELGHEITEIEVR